MTALAIEQFRNQHGQLPNSLDDLVPKLLAEISEDPFDGAELRYQLTGKGYMLYSIGRDRHDDGGLEETDKKQSSDGKSFDITFTVKR